MVAHSCEHVESHEERIESLRASMTSLHFLSFLNLTKRELKAPLYNDVPLFRELEESHEERIESLFLFLLCSLINGFLKNLTKRELKDIALALAMRLVARLRISRREN